MKNVLIRCASSALVVALAVGGGVALTTVAHAQAPADGRSAAPMPPRPPMGPDGPRMRGGHPMMQLERLKTSLRLDANQAALWDRARERMKPPADLHEQMKARHERMAAQLDDPAFDPRRLSAEMDSADAERRARTTAIRDAWFAVYDALNPAQRGQVREFLRSHLSRGHDIGGMHRRDGEHGHPPMPPAPPAPTAPR